MILQLSEAVNYVRKNPNSIPVPDWTHLNVFSKGTKVIAFKDIYIDDLTGNIGKIEGDTHTSEEIESLRMSFAGGVDTKEFPPGVVYRGDHYEKPYVLKYGFGRIEAVQELNQKEWYFTVLEGDDDAIEDVQASENEDLPKRLNREIDMKQFLARKIHEGNISNTESAIRAKFRKVYPNRSKEVCNRVVQMVMNDASTPQPFIIYTSTARIRQWLENHSRENYFIEGEYDPALDMYGTHIKEGYQYRTVIQAIKRYKETGKKTYVIGHFGAPTKKATLKVKRAQFIREFDVLRECLQHIGANVWPIHVLGFFPQDKENESMKELVKPIIQKNGFFEVDLTTDIIDMIEKVESELPPKLIDEGFDVEKFVASIK